ncbi:unnamed protein product, partial [Phaeothamnion confervicola]
IACIVSKERESLPDGLWSTRQFGEFRAGDARRSPVDVTGAAELRQLRRAFKLSFSDVSVEPLGRGATAAFDAVSSQALAAENGDPETAAAAAAAILPPLWVYLTKKRPKARMADIEETGYLLSLDVALPRRRNAGSAGAAAASRAVANGAGCLNVAGAKGSFDQALKDVPDVESYRGVVVVVRRQDEPIVCAFLPLDPRRRPLQPSAMALGLAEERDKALQAGNCGGAGGSAAAAAERARRRAARAAASGLDDAALLRGMRRYGRAARRAWQSLERHENDSVDFAEFKLMLDHLDVVMLEARAQRLFRNCDLDGSGAIDLSEFELALMMHDALPVAPFLTPLDSFRAFDLDGGGTVSWAEFRASAAVATAAACGKAVAAATTAAAEVEAAVATAANEVDYEGFKLAWLQLVDVPAELRRRGLNPSWGLGAAGRNLAVEAEDKAADEAFETVRGRVENVRREAREQRDRQRREKSGKAGKIGLEDAKGEADRRRQRRIMLKEEQAERARRRQEAKVQENRVLAERAENAQKTALANEQHIFETERERLAAVRARGGDWLRLERRGLRRIPTDVLQSPAGGAGTKAGPIIMRLEDVVVADLSGNKIREIPAGEFLGHMKALRKLDLSDNRLSQIPAGELGALAALQVLRLRCNDLSALPVTIGMLLQLRRLDISRNRLASLPPAVGQLTRLTSLVAHSNALAVLPSEVGFLASLELIDIAGNLLQELPPELTHLSALTSLDATGNRLERLPLETGQLAALRVLRAGHNRLLELPVSITRLDKLQVLDIIHNRIAEIGAAFMGMANLVDCNASHNRVARVGAAIGGCSQLQRLQLRCNRVAALPPELGLLTELRVLDLHDNRLTALPDEIGALIRLTALDVSRNALTALTDHISLLASLTLLDASHNTIAELPTAVGALAQLRQLELGGNGLGAGGSVAALPRSMRRLHDLERLGLSANRFTEFPLLLCDLPSLVSLDLSSNRIASTVIYGETSSSSLLHLDLRNNNLATLPLEFLVLDARLGPPGSLSLPSEARAAAAMAAVTVPPLGRTRAEVLEWLRAQNEFTREARNEWFAKAGLYLTGRANARDFVAAVAAALAAQARWRPYLENHVLR